jgi:hypothetical protein
MACGVGNGFSFARESSEGHWPKSVQKMDVLRSGLEPYDWGGEVNGGEGTGI